MPSSPKITQAQLKKLLHYNPATGVFTWKVDCVSGHGRVHKAAGSLAGGPDKHGYVCIGIDGRRYFAHQLAWLYVKGCWPCPQVDHRNCVKYDNRWRNLRQATHAQNVRNTKIRSDSKTMFKGVHFHKPSQRFTARIMVNCKRISLGYYSTPEDAHVAYCAASKRLHGEFSRTA